jgi:hypothetical protein
MRGGRSGAGMSPGHLQKLQAELSQRAAMAATLCHSAGWVDMEVPLTLLSQEAAIGAPIELLPLMQARRRKSHRAPGAALIERPIACRGLRRDAQGVPPPPPCLITAS